MKTSPTDAAAGAGALLVFLDKAGVPGCWLRLGDGEPGYGVAADGLPAAARTVLAVPGEQVTMHWLELGPGLAPAQAAAAARLMLADASAEPIAAMHVAIGRPESGRTPAAVVPVERMRGWLEAAAAAGIDPEAVVPSPMLLPPPESGFVRREIDELSDYRGPAAAFTLEPELAAALIGDALVGEVDEAGFEAALPPLLADPSIDLRQGPFARARRWRVEPGPLRRIGVLALALAVLSLAVQIAAILAYTFAADRARSEADALALEAGAGPGGPGFAAAAALLFDAVRATPNVELTRLDYRADGSLALTVTMDNAASLAALQSRIEASGLAVEPGEQRSEGGRPVADLTVRPA